jgi:hypothetical protein
VFWPDRDSPNKTERGRRTDRAALVQALSSPPAPERPRSRGAAAADDANQQPAGGLTRLTDQQLHAGDAGELPGYMRETEASSALQRRDAGSEAGSDAPSYATAGSGASSYKTAPRPLSRGAADAPPADGGVPGYMRDLYRNEAAPSPERDEAAPRAVSPGERGRQQRATEQLHAAAGPKDAQQVRKAPRWPQKLGQLQPSIAPYPQECICQLASSGAISNAFLAAAPRGATRGAAAGARAQPAGGADAPHRRAAARPAHAAEGACPMSATRLERQASELVGSDACPRPATGRGSWNFLCLRSSLFLFKWRVV